MLAFTSFYLRAPCVNMLRTYLEQTGKQALEDYYRYNSCCEWFSITKRLRRLCRRRHRRRHCRRCRRCCRCRRCQRCRRRRCRRRRGKRRFTLYESDNDDDDDDDGDEKIELNFRVLSFSCFVFEFGVSKVEIRDRKDAKQINFFAPTTTSTTSEGNKQQLLTLNVKNERKWRFCADKMLIFDTRDSRDQILIFDTNC